MTALRLVIALSFVLCNYKPQSQSYTRGIITQIVQLAMHAINYTNKAIRHDSMKDPYYIGEFWPRLSQCSQVAYLHAAWVPLSLRLRSELVPRIM